MTWTHPVDRNGWHPVPQGRRPIHKRPLYRLSPPDPGFPPHVCWPHPNRGSPHCNHGHIHPIDFEAAQQQPEATVFSATDEPRPSPDGGNNDVVSQHQGTVNKDDVSDKKRKAVEAIPPTTAAQRTKGNGQPSGALDPAIIDHGTPPPANDRMEGWLDDDAATDQGFIRTERKMYRPPLPSQYTEPEVEDNLLDGHDWVCKEHGKALHHTKEPLPPRDNIIQFADKPEYATKLDKNLRVDECPPDHQAAVRDNFGIASLKTAYASPSEVSNSSWTQAPPRPLRARSPVMDPINPKSS
jgi:hypothetical protein